MSSLISFSFCFAFLITVSRPIAVLLKAGHAAAANLDGVMTTNKGGRVMQFEQCTSLEDHTWLDRRADLAREIKAITTCMQSLCRSQGSRKVVGVPERKPSPT